MEFKLNINLDNSAYENIGWELGENLQAVIDRIGSGNRDGKIRDSNGNIVGEWEILDNESKQFIQDHFQFIHVK